MQKLALGFEKYFEAFAYPSIFDYIFNENNPVLITGFLIILGNNCYHYNLHNCKTFYLIYADPKRALKIKFCCGPGLAGPGRVWPKNVTNCHF